MQRLMHCEKYWNLHMKQFPPKNPGNFPTFGAKTLLILGVAPEFIHRKLISKVIRKQKKAAKHK